MLAYLHLCAVGGVVVVDYRDKASGTMVETDAGGASPRWSCARWSRSPTPAMVDDAQRLHAEAVRALLRRLLGQFPGAPPARGARGVGRPSSAGLVPAVKARRRVNRRAALVPAGVRPDLEVQVAGGRVARVADAAELIARGTFWPTRRRGVLRCM